MTKVEYSDERRTFLKTVALLGGATLCLPLTKEAAARQPPLLSGETSASGYRETEHIRKY